jgi:peptidoglycan/LPS O-acetylase OafA/YrhL
MVCHFLAWPLIAHQAVPLSRLDRTVLPMTRLAWAGVDLFFVLSGFLITRILLGARDGEGYFRSFYARRFLRIFPLYYGFLFLLIVILPSLPGLRGDAGLEKLHDHQLAYWTYLYNWAASLHPFADRGPYANSHLWSLAVEEQFYLVWPAVVLLLSRRPLAVFCVFCIVAAPVLRHELLHGAVPDLGLPFSTKGLNNPLSAYTLTPARMDTLAFGGLIAILAEQPAMLRTISRWARVAGVAAALFLAILYVREGGLFYFNEPVEVYGFSAMALAAASFVAVVVGGPPGIIQQVCGHRVLTFFGRYSYGIYVLHVQIMQWLIDLMDRFWGLRTVWGSYLPYQLAFAVVAAPLSIAAAWLSWHLWEKQFLKLKRFVPYGRAEQRLAAAQLTGRRAAD